MAFNGSGTYIRDFNWVTDKTNSVKITASRFDTENNGFATGLSNCITKDGQTTLTDNIPMNSKKFTGLGNGSARTDSIALGQVQDNTYGNLGASSGTDDYTATPSPVLTAYVASQRYTIEIGNNNTGATTLDINAVNQEALEKYDGAGATTALEVNDLEAGQKYDIIRDQANTKFIVLNPQKPLIDLTNSVSKATTTTAGISLLSSEIITSNGTDADHDIDFTAGNFIFSDGSGQAVASAITKQIDAPWVAGDDVGGLDTGTVANNTWYYSYSIYNPGTDTSDAILTATFGSPTLPAGYTKQSYKGAVRTDGSANIRQFRQSGNQFYYLNKGTFSAAGDFVATNYGTAQNIVTTLVPPQVGIITRIIARPSQTNNNQDRGFLVRSILETDTAVIQGGPVPATSDKFNIHMMSGSTSAEVYFELPTDDARIWFRGEHATDGSSGFVVITLGWIDTNL